MMYALLALAVYRMARMVALEDGPWNVFYRLRSLVVNYERGRRDSWLIRGVGCPACLSFWLGFVGAALLPWQGWAWYVVTALALSGAATWLYRQERP